MSPEIVLKNLKTGKTTTEYVSGRVGVLHFGIGKKGRDILQVRSEELKRVVGFSQDHALIEVRATDGSVNNRKDLNLLCKHPRKKFEARVLKGVPQPVMNEDKSFQIMPEKFGGAGRKRQSGLKRNRQKKNG